MRSSRRALFSWALYDLANTTFSLNLISRCRRSSPWRAPSARGRLIDAIGAKRALHAALALWIVGLGCALIPSRTALWLIGPLTGIALGALWSADRVLMFRLSPLEALGELYGLYGMVGRFSAITGPLIWGGMAGNGGVARRVGGRLTHGTRGV